MAFGRERERHREKNKELIDIVELHWSTLGEGMILLGDKIGDEFLRQRTFSILDILFSESHLLTGFIAFFDECPFRLFYAVFI